MAGSFLEERSSLEKYRKRPSNEKSRKNWPRKIRVEQPLTTVAYDYPTFHISMQCFLCKVEQGNLTLLEHEAARWLSYDELDSVDWLPADKVVVGELRKCLVKI